MELNVGRNFGNGTYRVELTATGDTADFARHADDIVSDVTATLDDDVLPAVAHAVDQQANQPAADSAVTDVEDSAEPAANEVAPDPVRSVNPVVETVQVNLHGVNVTLVVAIELKADLTTDVLDLQKIVRETVTGPTSIKINAAIVGACVLGVSVQVPSGLAGLLGSGLGSLLGVHGSYAHFGNSARTFSPRAAAPARSNNPFTDDRFDFFGPVSDFDDLVDGPTGPWNPRTTTIPRGW